MNVCVYGASSNDIDRSYIEETEYLGREIAKRGHTLVYGAGANGLMGAVARGVYEENGTIIGVTPSFFNVDGILFENVSELITTWSDGTHRCGSEQGLILWTAFAGNHAGWI
jgi:cytokinin riboside 5'-monophosphate phosphoribohydrolase